MLFLIEDYWYVLSKWVRLNPWLLNHSLFSVSRSGLEPVTQWLCNLLLSGLECYPVAAETLLITAVSSKYIWEYIHLRIIVVAIYHAFTFENSVCNHYNIIPSTAQFSRFVFSKEFSFSDQLANQCENKEQGKMIDLILMQTLLINFISGRITSRFNVPIFFWQ